mmetsp:Transcript_25760/g.38060  ORF Transcript_25760/g.38060 Transcript_25760/m.38060 type:complete len:92 (-) Transcript_25760:1542-1817(-)
MNGTKVRFSPENTTHSYPRPTASQLQDLYYQEEDYRRFREEKWLDELREKRQKNENERNEKLSKSRRRDSLTMLMNPNFGSQTQRGIAKAA